MLSLKGKSLVVVTTLCLLLVSGKLNAQIPLGFKVGVTANEIVFRKDLNGLPYNHQMMTSLHAGLFTKVKIIEGLTLIPEIQYIGKYSNYHAIGYNEVKLKYVEIPIVFSYRPLKWLAVEGGSWGFNIYDNTLLKTYSKNDAGLLGGIRINLTDNVSFMSRYYHGLTKLGPFVTESFNPLVEYMAYNQNLQFSIAYYLGK